MPTTCTIIYEVAADAAQLKAEATSLRILFGAPPVLIDLTSNAAAQSAPQAATQASTTGGPVATISGNSNLRKGPGTNYAVAAQGKAGQSLSIVGRMADGSWFEVCCIAGQSVWVSKGVVTTTGDVNNVPVSNNIPAPPPTAIPAPTAAPLATNAGIGSPEQRAGDWGLKLYDVKKAKTVYHYGTGTSAKGVWFVPLVEFRNYGTGTAQPSDRATVR